MGNIPNFLNIICLNFISQQLGMIVFLDNLDGFLRFWRNREVHGGSNMGTA